MTCLKVGGDDALARELFAHSTFSLKIDFAKVIREACVFRRNRDIRATRKRTERDREGQREIAYDEVFEMYEGLIWDSECDHEIDAEELYKHITSMWEFEKQTTAKN